MSEYLPNRCNPHSFPLNTNAARRAILSNDYGRTDIPEEPEPMIIINKFDDRDYDDLGHGPYEN